jgi:hypothetical protein
METGTQIILQRMKDCPEEFANDGELFGKWERALMGYKEILPQEDIEALDAAYRQMRIDKFNEVVLKTLAGEEPKQETVTYKTKDRYITGFTDPRGLFGSAVAKGEGQPIQDQAEMQARAMQNQYGTDTNMGVSGLMNSTGLWGGR